MLGAVVALALTSTVPVPAPASAAMAAPAAAAALSGSPGLRLPAGVRPLRYRLELTLEPAEDIFRGRVEIDIALAAPASRLWLNAVSIEVDEAFWIRDGKRRRVPVVAGGSDHVGFDFPAAEAAGKGTLSVSYRGQVLDKDTSGIFHQKDGEDWYLFSQLEAVDARRMTPCFDEPSFKVPWQLTLRVPEDLVAASNTPMQSEEDEEAGMKLVRFAETEPLPSYLIAVAVGPFDVVEGGTAGSKGFPLRVLALRGRAREAQHVFDTTREVITRLERYFGSPYPFAKLDQVAIPETVSFGAMENPGLVTYNARSLLQDPDRVSIQQRRRFAGTNAHEMAHMWFGNLVTLAWWDDTWLNEAFATWMADKVIEDWKPEWDNGLANVGSRRAAMASDTLITARKVRQPIEVKDDIEGSFDGISYAKGAALLATFESWLGEERFRAGVRSYLAKHARGNATAADFLAAIAAAGRPELAPAFTTFLEQAGIPLLSVELECPTGTPRLRLEQRRFLPLGSTGVGGELWQVPVCVRYDGGEGKSGRDCLLMTTPSAELPLSAASACPQWLQANDGGIGYYVVSYRGDLLSRLLAAAGDSLSLAENSTLLSDVGALVDAGELGYPQALALVPRVAVADSRHLVTSAARIVSGLDRHLVPAELRPNYARFVCDTFGARANRLGLDPAPGEADDVRLLRSTLVSLVAVKGEDPGLLGRGRTMLMAWLEDRNAIDRDLVATVLGLVAPNGDEALFERLLAEARKTTDRRERGQLFAALGSFRNPALQRRALALVLDPALDARQLGGILYGGADYPENRAVAFDFVKANFDALAERLPAESMARLAAVGSAFCDEERRVEVEAFFGPRLLTFPGGRKALDRTLESMSVCIARRVEQLPGVAAFLTAY